MRLSILFLALVFSFLTITAQERQDSVKVRTLAKRIKEKRYWATYPDSINLLALQGMAIASAANDRYGVADMHKFLGIYHWSVGNNATAIEHYLQAKTIYDSLGRAFESAQTLSNLGMVYSKLSDNEKALEYFQNAILIMERQPKPDLASMAGTFSSMGLLLRNHNDLPAARQMFETSLKYYGQVGDSLNIAGNYTNLATVYTRMQKYDSGAYFNHQAIKLFQRLNNVRGQVIAYNNLGAIASAQGKFDESIAFLRKAEELNIKGGSFESRIATLIGLGQSNLGKNNFREAEDSFQKALAIAKGKNRSKLIEIYKGLSEAYRGLQNWEEAFAYYDNYSQLKDSIYNQDNAALMSNLRVSYEVERKNAEIKLLAKDNKIAILSRNMTIVIALGILFVVALAVYVLVTKMRKDKKLMSQERELAEARQQIIEKELVMRKEKEEELSRELEFRNRALTTYTLNLVQKNGMLDEIRGVIHDLIKEPGQKETELKKLIRLIDYSFTLDKDWDGFKTYFEQVHPDFFKKLKESFPQLSATELKLCALIRLSLSIKESASVLSISPDSVKVSRHRVRKKLGLTTDNNLTEFIMAV